MVERIIYETREGHVKRKLILWIIPLMIIFVGILGIFMAREDATLPKAYPIYTLLAGVVWLGLLIFFAFKRKV